MPDTIVAVDTIKESLSVKEKIVDSTPTLANKEVAHKDTPIIPVYTDVDNGKTTEEITTEKPVVAKNENNKQANKTEKVTQDKTGESEGVGYKVISVAYFYNEPNEGTRRKAYINHWNNSYATLKADDEKNGFIYVVFKNHLGQTSRGWLRKKDLTEVRSIAKNDEK